MDNSTFIKPVMHFTVWDHSIFVSMLVVSGLIGVYYGFVSKRKQNNTSEYLMGGKKMATIPIAISLIASHISGITVLGLPAEVYANGTQSWAFIFPAITVYFTMVYVFLPVFYDLQLTSCFGYLEQRFNVSVRKTASLIFAINCLIYIPIVIYVPALALSQVTGFDIHVITPIICVVCTFYTTVGGLRAVVWTDTLQFFLMMFALISLIFLGLKDIGGFNEMWTAADRGKRLILFNLDPSPFVKSSFWTMSIGLSFLWVSHLGVNQGCIQKFLAVPDRRKANRSVLIYSIGLIGTKILSIIIGLLIYAKYETCDPITTKAVSKPDQILPLYVTDVAQGIPGLPGLLIAGIFSASLATMSASMNTLAGSLFEDFFRPIMPTATEKTASNVMKLLAVTIGIIETVLVYIVEHLGEVFHIALALNGVTGGALLGMFTIGMISKRATTKGSLIGAITSILFVASMAVGHFMSPRKKSITLPLNTDGCDSLHLGNLTTILWSNMTDETTTIATPVHDPETDKFFLFRISGMYFTLIGFVIVFVVGFLVSCCSTDKREVNEILLTPLCRSKAFKEQQKKNESYLAVNNQTHDNNNREFDHLTIED